MIRRPAVVVGLVAVLVAGAVVAVAALRGGCAVDDAAARPAGPATAAADLRALGLGPATHTTAVGYVETLVAAPDADVIVTNGPDDSAGSDVGAAVVGLDPATGQQRWSVGVPGAGASVAVVDGRVVGATRTDRVRVFGLDAATGADRWCVELDGVDPRSWSAPGDRVPLAAAAGRAVLAWTARDGTTTVAGVDPRTGDVAWRRPGAESSLTPAGDRVLGSTGTAYAAADGAVTRPSVDGVLVAADARSAVLRTGETLTATDPAGSVRWTAPDRGRGARADTAIAGDAVVDVVFGGGDRAGLQGLDAATGRERWRVDDARLGGSAFRAFAAGPRLVVAGDRAVGVVDPATGDLRTAAVDGIVEAVAADGEGRTVLVVDGTLAGYPPA